MLAVNELAAIIYRARWVDGMRDVAIATDASIAAAILAAGYSKSTETEVS